MVLRTSSLAPTGPVRTCVGCRQRAAKRELLRVTVGADQQGHPVLVPDPRATAPGRGAHLHPTSECLELAVRRRAFGRALRVTGDLGPGLSSAPLAEYLDRLAPAAPDPPDPAAPPVQSDQPGNRSSSS